jgi:DNA helicase HerA-like ATPase
MQKRPTSPYPEIPAAYTLRKYQNEAIEEWKNRGYRGIYDMATGTGKTITLKVMAESFSALGVPVFLADVKGDLAGCCRTGERTEAIDRRLTAMGLDPETFRYQPFPVRFWDVYGEMGHPVRTTVSEMGAPLLSRLLDLTAVQEGVLTIVFRVADEKGWLLSDLKDLRAMVNYVAEHADEYRSEYGNVSKQSAGAIQRSLLQLEDAGGDLFFGEPDIELSDWFQTDDKGKGYINILHCERLYRSPLLYATFLLWLLAELFEQLPEVGDPEQPKLVFFFDEAHLLFDDAPKALVDKVEQVVRLIRSKGVGVFFITQRPSDVPDSVLAQLGNKVQHALRAYTPAEQKAVRAAAQGFRANPAFDTQDAIMDLGTGEALVSFLDEKGRPSVVERVTILPPQSLMGPIDERRRSAELSYDELYGKYETPVDPESAYEIITADREAAAKAEAEAQAAKEREKLEQQKEKEKKATSKRRTSAGRKVANSALNAVGREMGRSFTRGLLGTLKKWF